jgi:hypothetical protein
MRVFEKTSESGRYAYYTANRALHLFSRGGVKVHKKWYCALSAGRGLRIESGSAHNACLSNPEKEPGPEKDPGNLNK